MIPRKSHLLFILGAFAAGMTAALLVLMLMGRGNAPAPSAIGGPFQLIDQTGRAVTEQDLKGKPSLIFFGFTHCPDICPTTLFEVSEILGALGEEAARVNALFVTVDPERDDAAQLKLYLSSFHPVLRGLTGSPENIAAMLKAYRVYSRKVPLKDGGYTMDHTALVYLLDREGRFVAPFNMKLSPEAAAAELRKHF
jgi:protein SCO1/2